MKFKQMLIALLSSLLISSSFAFAASDTGLNIYFVRHGETLGNSTHHHSKYNDRTFSAKGQKQVKELTRKLDSLHFDHILVSPKYRAMNTIFPYLKKHHLKAEIWPELEECCWQKERDISAFELNRGNKITVEQKMQPYFTFPDATARYRYAPKGYADGMIMIFKSIDQLRSRFAGSGKIILIVGHYHAGSRMIELLQDMEPEGRYKISNAKISQLKESANGSFQLLFMNQ